MQVTHTKKHDAICGYRTGVLGMTIMHVSFPDNFQDIHADKIGRIEDYLALSCIIRVPDYSYWSILLLSFS